MHGHAPSKDESIPTITSEGCLSTKAFNSFRVIAASKCLPALIWPNLEEYMRGKRLKTTVEELENALFLLGKELMKTGKQWEVSLKPFVMVHPLLALARQSEGGKGTDLASKELTKVIRAEPVQAKRYLWTLKALEFINDLALKWGLLSPRQFAHRANLSDSVLCECPRLDSLCLLPEVLYLSLSPTPTFIPPHMDSVCAQLAAELANLLQILPSLNQEIDFEATPHISDFLFRSGKIVPEVPSMKEKTVMSARVGFHLLTLPTWWKCECVLSETERTNTLIYRSLSSLCQKYCQLERHIAGLQQPLA